MIFLDSILAALFCLIIQKQTVVRKNMARKFVWSRYHVYLLQGCVVSLGYPNYNFGTFTVSEKISKDSIEVIYPADIALYHSDVFLTETDYHERVFEYRAFQTYHRSVE
jgi:hypothetical protein